MQVASGRGGKYKWPNLSELHIKLFGNSFDEAHNAAADVEATTRCFLELIRLSVIPHDQVGMFMMISLYLKITIKNLLSLLDKYTALRVRIN